MNYFEDSLRLVEEKKIESNLLESQGYCIICSHDDPLDLEFHHIGAKSNSTLIVSLCRNCHDRISRRQRYWPKGWYDKSKSQDSKDTIVLRGISDLLRVIADVRGTSLA
ncbi:MAG: hypothetical protein HRU07_03940 [Nitrosopumilus sp.]|nr:hypothetical protein [Nitrosopumilus sp.]NRA05306.1 hypothetical protein [Nitrosopumilus sp.]